MTTRRQFLRTSTAVAATTLLRGNILGASIAAQQPAGSPNTRRLADGWEYWQGTMGGAWEVWHSEETSAWTKVAMPHSFNMHDGCDPDVPYYQGQGWYRTWLDVKNPYGIMGDTLLHFEGCGQEVEVFIGDISVGKHLGGYDEFVVAIGGAIDTWNEQADAKSKAKGVPLAIRCDNSRDLNRMPANVSDFSIYGGLYRHVNLIYVPEVFLEQVHVEVDIPIPTSKAKITVRCSHHPGNAVGMMPITYSIFGPDGTLIHHFEDGARLEEKAYSTSFEIEHPKLWHPDTPHLYRCRVAIQPASFEQTLETTFGIKHTEFIEHGPFKLNGERLLLRGTQRHEDHAGFANAMPDALIEEELKLVKAMGCNFIRLGHYQQSRRVLDLCDSLGLLVWEEVPWCRDGIGPDSDPQTRAIKQMGRDKLRNMITQHYNHPSILFWGLGNEDDWPTEYPNVDQENIRGYMKELNDLAHSLDPSRYTSFRRCDFARDIPDVYSPSIWAGWYSGTYPEYQKSLEAQRDRVKNMIHIEWGADSHAGRHSENPDKVLATIATGHGTDERGLAYLGTGGDARVSKDGDWSETYACNLFDWHLKVQESLDWFTGSAMWVFKDFTTPLRPENPVPRINQKGVVARDMTPKEGFYVFQSYWAKEPMARIYGHSWPVRWGNVGEQKMIKVYSNCDTAEMFLNGKSLGVKKRDAQDFPCAGLRWLTPFVEGTNKLRVVAKKGSKTVTDETEFIYQTKNWGKPATFQLARLNATTAEVTLHDADGTLCLDAKNAVRFSVAGGATLIDNQGTPWGSRVVQLANGRTRISLSNVEGKNSIAVESDGVPTAVLSL